MAQAFLFPGQAAQYVGMGRDLYDAIPAARAIFDLADEIRPGLRTACFEGPEDALRQTAITQPAVFSHSIAALKAMESRHIRPDFVAGHSVGEMAALVAAGVISPEDGVRVVCARGLAMQEAGQARAGAMAAILGLEDKVVVEVCTAVESAGVVVPANYNCPGQVVISGESEAVSRASEEAMARGAKRAIELPVSGAFHSEMMEPAVRGLADALEGVPFHDATVPVVPNVTAEPTRNAKLLKELLIEQIVSPVRWTESIGKLASAGVSRAFEVGPGSALQGMVRRIDRSVKVEKAGSLDEIERLT